MSQTLQDVVLSSLPASANLPPGAAVLLSRTDPADPTKRTFAALQPSALVGPPGPPGENSTVPGPPGAPGEGAAPTPPRIIASAGTVLVGPADTAVFIDGSVVGTVAFTLSADYPLGQPLLLVDARLTNTSSVITPTGNAANIVGGPTFTLDNSFGGWASINLRRSAIGWAVS